MRTPYQDAFDHVTASERLKGEVSDMTKREKQELRRRVPKFILIAAVIVLLLAGTALAVNMPSLQDWFRQYWAEATGEDLMNARQEAVMNSLTQSADAASNVEDGSEGTSLQAAPSGDIPTQAADQPDAPDTTQSPSADPAPATSQAPTVTVSLDSVAVGEDTLWMLVHVTGNYEAGKRYSFGRGKLLGAPEKEFSELGITVSSGVASKQCEVLADGSLQILLHYQCLNPSADLTQGGTYQLQLENLMMERNPVQEGQWSLSFSLDEAAASPPVVLEHISLPVEGLDGQDTVEFEEIRITSTGVRLVCQPQFSGYRLWTDVALILADGSEIAGSGGHGTWTGEADTSSWYSAYNWDLPVALEQAAAIRIGETVVPLSQE